MRKKLQSFMNLPALNYAVCFFEILQNHCNLKKKTNKEAVACE